MNTLKFLKRKPAAISGLQLSYTPIFRDLVFKVFLSHFYNFCQLWYFSSQLSVILAQGLEVFSQDVETYLYKVLQLFK